MHLLLSTARDASYDNLAAHLACIMADSTPENRLELFEGHRSRSGRHARRGKCTAFQRRWVLCVVVVVILLVVVGILMAMFGPGSKDLKYHDREECEGTEKDKEQTSRPYLQCDVAIIGGGLSGLYMAETLLRKKKETSVCVFEKEDRFGGRIFDYWFPQAPDITVGLGAWRIVSDATNMINLIGRLNISTINWDYHYPSIEETRGIFSNSSMTIKNQAFPTLNTGKFRNMTRNEMASYAFRDEYVSTAPSFSSVDSYMSYYLTPEGAEFLSDAYGFKGDYTEPINPAAYIEYLKLPISSKHQRPLKGMSEVIDGLVSSVKLHGGTLYKNSEVSSIEKLETKYIITTLKLTVSAKKLVIATHPTALTKIKGDVAETIHREPAFQSIFSMPAFKGAAVYKEAWWSNRMVTNLTLEPRQKFISNSNCLGVTLPHRGNGPNGEAVLHTMYSDGACSRRWGDILSISKSAVDRELKRALEYKFGGPVPDPLDTVYQYWDEGAWHFQKPGSNVTLSEVSNWAKRPFPEKDIFVIGDAYNPYRGWTQGAIMSADNALLEGWQLQDKSSSQKKYNLAVSLSELMRDPSRDLQNH